MKTVNLLVRDVPDELRKKIREMAAEEKISVNQLCLKFILQYLDDHRQEIDRAAREKKVRNRVSQRLQKIRARHRQRWRENHE